MMILIAWITEEKVWDEKPFRSDIGEYPKFLMKKTPHSLCWCNDGGEEDLARAEDFVKNRAHTLSSLEVLRAKAYVMTEQDDYPFALARAKILKETN